MSKPELGPVLTTPARRRFSIQLRELPGQAIGVAAQDQGKPVAPEVSVQPRPAFQFSYSDFLKSVPGARTGSPKELAAARDRELQKLGDAIGRAVFAGDIDRELASCLTEATRLHYEIELIYEAATPRLLAIPFEAARLSDGRVPSLVPGVFSWRSLASVEGPFAEQGVLPGPLKVLVAVGAPDEGKTPNSVLDSERELQTILDALEKARRLGNAHVRVLEIGSPDQIGAALREHSYHVLHLSGHGNKGVLELEDEDGNPVHVTLKELAKKIHESGHRAPLVFLSFVSRRSWGRGFCRFRARSPPERRAWCTCHANGGF
jgi:hypothetical protein